MTLLALCVLAAVAAVGAEVALSPHCPHPECVCSAAEGTKTGSKQTAICNQMPKTAMVDSIAQLKVTAPLFNVTKHMIAMMGPGVKSLDMSYCEITTLEIGAFENATRIVTLRLSNNYISEISQQTFAKQSNVKYLYLDGNNLKVFDESVFSSLVNLKQLYLQRNQLVEVPGQVPPNLERLDLSYNKITSPNTQVIQGSLKVLDLCGNNFGELSLNDSIAAHNLTSLCLGGQAVALPAHVDLVLPALQNFSLIAEPEAKAELHPDTQAALAGMVKLEQLMLIHYKVESLLFLQNLTELKVLKLHFINVGQMKSTGLALVTTHLEELFLDNSPEFVHALMTSPDSEDDLDRLCRLSYLGLSGTGLHHPLTDLVPQKSFFLLDLSNNPLNCTCELASLHTHLAHLGNTLCDGRSVESFIKESRCLPPEDVVTPTIDSFSNPYNSATVKSDDYTTLYIVLGSILAILVVVGIILAAIYTKFKKNNQIVPGDEPTQSEQSLQQIQKASSEDMLIKK